MTARTAIVGIETSGRTASISLLLDGELDVRFLDDTGRRHARTLIPELKQLLHDHNIAPSDLSGVGVTVGPGSFTGLRVGITCAKTLGWGCQIATAGIGTFDILREQCRRDYPDAWLAMNAERGELFVSRPNGGDSYDAPVAPYQLMSIEAFLEQLPDDVTIAGPLPRKITDALPSHVSILADLYSLPSAGQVAQIARSRIGRNDHQSPFDLVPEYGRLSAAEEKRAEAR